MTAHNGLDPFQAKLVAAATGSTMTALTMTPFDVVKTRLQTQRPVPFPLFPRASAPSQLCCQPPNKPCVRSMSSLARPIAAEELVCVWHNGVMSTERVTGFFDAIKHIWKAEGTKGLWKGSGTTLVIGVPSSTAYMLTYDHLLNKVLPAIVPYESLIPLTAGITARSTITCLASPLELVRTNLQSTPISPGTPHTLRSVLVSVRQLVRSQGPLCLWRGLGATLWRDVPFSGIYWLNYESMKKGFSRRGHEGAWISFICGAVSGTGAALITSPMDVLKTRRQALVMTAGSPTGVSSTFGVLAQIIRTEGASALFTGIVPRVAKIAPACGIMIGCFEGVGKFLVKHEQK
ncbi:mitochondrial carrier [Cylindrobasidium torrendii FP15055 ss-10]|uniref:Mitochondrial carrier n=1 Tax=Cylindrobasidium torrendii FP15055 ss-10 TaxID=1314674 RepID=A0A0D7BRF4_9AGAR|nr:mitochondrial carrier [Cylindrobasidium torrendii FP15055 ss-10]